MRKLIILFLLAVVILYGCSIDPHASNDVMPKTATSENTSNEQITSEDNNEWWKSIDLSNGIYLVVCETGPDDYKCTILPLNNETVDKERARVGAKWMSQKDIAQALAWYQLPNDKIVIKPYADPASSYSGTKDKGELFDKMEALFDNKYKVGQQFRDTWERLKNNSGSP